MVKDMILVDRDALLDELQTIFDSQTADTLLSVLDKVASQVHAAGVTREDFSELKQIVAEIAEEQRKIAEELRKLVEIQRRNEERFGQFEQDLKILKSDVGTLKGYALEARYRDRAPSYFGKWLRRAKVVELNSLLDTLETHLSEEEIDQLLPLDLIVTGKPKKQTEAENLYLAIEISAVVDNHDIQRARERAALLQKAGYRAIPVAAGEKMTLEAEEEARTYGVAVVQDGRKSLWNEVLTQ